MKKNVKRVLSVILTIALLLASVPLVFAAESEKIEFNSHYYQVFDESMTWMEAKDYCNSLGGHLVTITSQEENDFIKNLAEGGNKSIYWYGASDSEQEGVWKWVTGEPFEYTDWAANEPNNEGDEDYLVALERNAYRWNDGSFDGGGTLLPNHGFICEWENTEDKFEYNGHRYQVFNKSMTWLEAKAYCENIGGHLVTITSKEENDFIMKLLPMEYYYIGATDNEKEGVWKWVTGEQWNYTNWDSKNNEEPNNGEGINDNKPQNYGAIYGKKVNTHSVYGCWDDAWGSGEELYGSVNGFICEWDVIASGYCGASTQWKLDSNGVLTISGTGIVKHYNRKNVAPWLKYADKINSVVVNDGITRLGEFTFYECTNLTSITIADSVKEISGYAFKGCSNLIEIKLSDNLGKIGDSAFYGTGLTSITIPATVKSLGYYAFSRCYALKNIEFLGDSPYFYSNVFNMVTAAVTYPADNISWNATKKQSYGGELKYIEKGCIDEGLCGSGTYWKLSNDGVLTLSGTGVVKHYDKPALVPWLKYADKIKNVVVKNGVTRVGEFAFYGCSNLTSVTIADTVKEISGYVFKNCSSLKEITLPKNLEKIGDSAFYGTDIIRIVIPASVNYIGYYAFSRCYSLKLVIFQGNAPTFCTNVFNKVSTEVVYPNNNPTWKSVDWDKLGGKFTHIS